VVISLEQGADLHMAQLMPLPLTVSCLSKIQIGFTFLVICLERGADLHIDQLMPLPLTVSCFSKIQIGLPLWYRLTRVVPDKAVKWVCVCVCVVALTSQNSGKNIFCLLKLDITSVTDANENGHTTRRYTLVFR